MEDSIKVFTKVQVANINSLFPHPLGGPPSHRRRSGWSSRTCLSQTHAGWA